MVASASWVVGCRNGCVSRRRGKFVGDKEHRDPEGRPEQAPGDHCTLMRYWIDGCRGQTSHMLLQSFWWYLLAYHFPSLSTAECSRAKLGRGGYRVQSNMWLESGCFYNRS